jgi:signal transduction histidine kinase
LAKLRLALGVTLGLAVCAGLFFLGRSSTVRHLPLPYLYEDTRQLVDLVESAARLLEQQGTGAFRAFDVRGSRWLNDTYYLFIYNAEGVCLFHPATPELVGKSLIKFRDMNGKPVVQWIRELGQRPEPNASRWIFYLWEPRSDLTPTWKAAYVRKAVGPDGRVYLVGCGVHTFKIETVFVKHCVDKAVELLQTQGKEAGFAQFRDRASPFYFCDTFIYVLDPRGRCLVDPAFPTLETRDLRDFKDSQGHFVVREMLKRLKKHDTAWVQYMLPRPGATLPSRKLAYVRKVVVNGETLLVGADFFLATPIWMKQ